MPYNCEDCGGQGARMNSMFEIRLCETCSHGSKYKLICKSVGIKQYKLTESDLANNQHLRQFHCKNPYWKSGPAMTLYLESEIQEIFLVKYHDVITNKLGIHNPNSNIANTVIQVIEFLEDSKNKVKQDKFDKILNKYSLDLESLPKWVKEQLEETKSCAEFERILLNYIRFKKLYKILKGEGLEKYIDHSISHDYIYANRNANPNANPNPNKLIKKINPEQIPGIIRFMLNKKKILKNAIKKYNLPVDKYKELYRNFINSTDFINSNGSLSNRLTISNDLDMLVNHVVDRETRLINLTTELDKYGLEIRSDSILCSKYLGGDDSMGPEQIAIVMDQMRWFFTHTKYSQYSREYDREQREYRYDYYYDNYYERGYRGKYYSDSDSDSDDEESREHYNKKKSDYVKKQCLREWIQKGKPGVQPPPSLNYLIGQIEYELEEELERKKKVSELNKQKQNIVRSSKSISKSISKPKLKPNQINCSNKQCGNLGSSSCIGLRCGICCDGVNCNTHRYKL